MKYFKLLHSIYVNKAEIEKENQEICNILLMREDTEHYIKSLYLFAQAFIRKAEFKRESKSKLLSDMLSVSDEAFLHTCLQVYFGSKVGFDFPVSHIITLLLLINIISQRKT